MTHEEAKEWLETEHDGEFLKEKGHADLLGLQILAKYANKPDDDLIVAAEHDIFYSIEHPEEMPKEEILQLHRLGFMLDDDEGCWAKFA